MYFKIDGITNETPITFLTVGQLLSVLNSRSEEKVLQHEKKEIPLIYGIDICKEVTGLAKPTIYRNTSKNLMPHYRRDGKLLFKREEVYAWMTENKVKTQSEFLQELDSKLTNKKSRK
ncbi:MAG TPA: helix-turn-helix domain-containing protein [Paludibacter sp.]